VSVKRISSIHTSYVDGTLRCISRHGRRSNHKVLCAGHVLRTQQVRFEQKFKLSCFRLVNSGSIALKFNQYPRIESIDSEHFLVAINLEMLETGKPYTCDIYIFQIDMNELSCKLLDTKTIDGYFEQRILDVNDPWKFVIYNRSIK
jgi:hypothetical protein